MGTHKKGYVCKKHKKQLTAKQKAQIKELKSRIEAKEREIGKFVIAKGGSDSNMVAKAQGYVRALEEAIEIIKK